MRPVAPLFFVACALGTSGLGAQSAGSARGMAHSETVLTAVAESVAVTEFASASRVAVVRFRDRAAAIEAGYHRIGMDFPSMGEHWVNTSVLYQGGFDVAKPALISYAVIDGRPTLTGAVYAVFLLPGETPPPVPGGQGMWHDHSGTLTDESSVPVHHGAMSDTSSTRLLVLHAWVGIRNPAGLFEADNWALPYVRAGVPVPTTVSIDAAKALSLLSGAKEYYISLANADGASPKAIVPALDSCAKAAALIAERMRERKISTKTDIDSLETAWRSALHAISRDAGQAVAARLNGGKPLATTPE